jgi:hypothetical protein
LTEVDTPDEPVTETLPFCRRGSAAPGRAPAALRTNPPRPAFVCTNCGFVWFHAIRLFETLDD